MEKIWLIIQREYTSRVFEKKFWLTTLLIPLGMFALIGFVTFLMSYKDDAKRTIAIIDPSGIIEKMPETDGNTVFVKEARSLEAIKADDSKDPYTAIVVLPEIVNVYEKKYNPTIYIDEAPSPELSMLLNSKIKEQVTQFKINTLQIDTLQLAALKTSVNLSPAPLYSEKLDATEMTGFVAAAIGGFMSFLMYLVVIIYGMMVMRSVMEEKTNRIIEVLVSSINPRQLMWGKIIGLGAVGITQTIVWLIMFGTLGTLAPTLMMSSMVESSNVSSIQSMEDPSQMAAVITELGNHNWVGLGIGFLLFFIGGYFLYASLFAAVGAAMGDDYGEGQTLTLPIMLPIIVSFYIVMSVINAPHSDLAFWSSLFPLFSPIIMPARMAFSVPIWQTALSLVLLFITCWFLVGIAGKIYRNGIMQYGKQSSFKELGKWIIGK